MVPLRFPDRRREILPRHVAAERPSQLRPQQSRQLAGLAPADGRGGPRLHLAVPYIAAGPDHPAAQHIQVARLGLAARAQVQVSRTLSISMDRISGSRSLLKLSTHSNGHVVTHSYRFRRN